MTKDEAIEKALATIWEVYGELPDGEKQEFANNIKELINKDF